KRSRARVRESRPALRQRSLRRRDLFLLVVPCSEHFCFAFGCKTGAQFRLSILWERLEPGECIASSFGERPECQPFAQRAIDLCVSESAPFSSPNRHVRPCLDFLVREKILCYPCKRRVRFQCSFDFIEHCTDA